MLGYVTILRDELKIREFDLYQAYYCGICKSIAARYGNLPRLVLSYDSVFLAMLLAGAKGEEASVNREHCILHHIKKKPVAHGAGAIDYAADMLIISAYHKFMDDRSDEHRLRGGAGVLLLTGAYRRLEAKYPSICGEFAAALAELGRLEGERSPSLDKTSQAFARCMQILFTGYLEDAGKNRVLSQIASELGKWIYIIDAADDFDADMRSGAYNPLRYRREGRAELGPTLYHHLADMAASRELLDIGANSGIIDNIVYLGLRARTDQILAGREQDGREVLRQNG